MRSLRPRSGGGGGGAGLVPLSCASNRPSGADRICQQCVKARERSDWAGTHPIGKIFENSCMKTSLSCTQNAITVFFFFFGFLSFFLPFFLFFSSFPRLFFFFFSPFSSFSLFSFFPFKIIGGAIAPPAPPVAPPLADLVNGMWNVAPENKILILACQSLSSRNTPYLGQTDRPFYMLFHIISIPFLQNFSQMTLYLGNFMVTLIPFLLFCFIFFRLGKYRLCDAIRTLSPILGRLFKGEVQSRITIISKESIKISLQIGAKMTKIG